MRPPRVIILVAFGATLVLLTFLSFPSPSRPKKLSSASSSSSSATTSAASISESRASIRNLFALRAPFSLFSPNAIITLTHDNTTAFLARPAAFGPLLPKSGLKGQLWIGSGFGDDSIRQGANAAAAEGELGCSDVPGWIESYVESKKVTLGGSKSKDESSLSKTSKSNSHKRSEDIEGSGNDESDPAAHRNAGTSKSSLDDGTDDYLHQFLPGSLNTPAKDVWTTTAHHADIQSIQEGAEIAGKVVLLSRGGCGFLEKVKWAQRRGGIAIIVGDNTMGGPLIQMYARGDTSEVHIPAVFTSHTTAHLLSSLMGPGNFIEDILDETGKPIPRVRSTDNAKRGEDKQDSLPNFTPTIAVAKATKAAQPVFGGSRRTASKATKGERTNAEDHRGGWFSNLFSASSEKSTKSESSRPPSSGQLDWILVEDWKDDDYIPKKSSTKSQPVVADDKISQQPKSDLKDASGDNFVIGVQDWRDPDLVEPIGGNGQNSPVMKVDDKKYSTKTEIAAPKSTKTGKKHIGGALQDIPNYYPPLRGGSITPGSGEYTAGASSGKGRSTTDDKKDSINTDGKSKGILKSFFGDDEEDSSLAYGYTDPTDSGSGSRKSESLPGSEKYDGLWVTLTPTSGGSPFLDTILVLVVSPLITLTVVYALLLLRSRMRRRRWRAPKSVVEQLPVRTYQTIVTSGTATPRIPASGTTTPTPTTPLLQHSGQSRPRPRSRTTTGIPEAGDIGRASSSPLQVPNQAASMGSRIGEREKTPGFSSEWKKYMGRQVECVVCLEEYVDGVSRVMSLPCGHEFHVDCITPWLVTRRRTCPICKGDVVRSLARGSPSSARYDPYNEDSDDELYGSNENFDHDSTASNIRPTEDSGADLDLEQGVASSSSPVQSDRGGASSSSGGWMTMITGSFGVRTPAPHTEDRTR